MKNAVPHLADSSCFCDFADGLVQSVADAIALKMLDEGMWLLQDNEEERKGDRSHASASRIVAMSAGTAHPMFPLK
jgi:hypothetical protein